MSVFQSRRLGTGCWQRISRAQDFSSKAELERAEKRRKEAAESLQTLADLLVSRKEQAAVVTELKTALSKAKEDATKKELEAKIKGENDKLAQISAQISGLSTGVAENSARSAASAIAPSQMPCASG